jgi:hypothetical protein
MTRSARFAVLSPVDPYPDASLVLDFVGARTGGRPFYKGGGALRPSMLAVPGSSYSRTGQELARTAGGVLLPFATNVPAITDLGLPSWDARTNKSANFNANPTDLTGVSLVDTGSGASVAVVDDTTEIAAAGLGAICTSGKVYRVIAGTAIAFANITGGSLNANPHVLSAYIRGGAGDLRYSGGGTLVYTFTASGAYRRVISTSTAPDATRTMMVGANAGQTVYFILNQMEEGGCVTPPIVVAGASATRGASTMLISGLVIPNPHTLFAEWVKESDDGAAFAPAASLENGSGGEHLIYHRHTTNAVRGYVSATADQTLGTGVLNVVQRAVVRFETNNVNGTLNGAIAGAADTSATLNAVERLYVGVRTATGSPLHGYVRRVALYPYAMPDAEMIARTAP